MSWRLRGAVALVAAVGVLGLLTALAPLARGGQGVAPLSTHWAVFLVLCCVASLLGILYGHATRCPACGKWWAVTKVETGFVERKVFARGGVPFGRSTYRTTYACACCGHRWSAAHTDEYPESIRAHSPRRPG
jgi:hypothetical protein